MRKRGLSSEVTARIVCTFMVGITRASIVYGVVCYNRTFKYFEYYGGRGIEVCADLMLFENGR